MSSLKNGTHFSLQNLYLNMCRVGMQPCCFTKEKQANSYKCTAGLLYCVELYSLFVLEYHYARIASLTPYQHFGLLQARKR